jgi:hypothetical protein
MIQLRRESISGADRLARPPLRGGIWRSGCDPSTAWRRRLSDGFAGTMAGPESPPWRAAARESRARFPFIFPASWLWHSRQWVLRRGWIVEENAASSF